MSGAVEARLGELGTAIELRADRPLGLTGGGWLVEEGKVDVFAVPGDDGAPSGPRRHLFRAEPGQLLLGLADGGGDRGLALLAVGTPGTRLLSVARRDLTLLLREPGVGGELRALLDRWVELLCASLVDSPAPGACEELGPGRLPAKGTARRIRPGRGVVWVRQRTGRSRWLGQEGIEVADAAITPLSHHAWLELPGGGELEVRESADEELSEAEVWEGLSTLHDLFLDSIVRLAELASADERDRLRRRTANDLGMLRGACVRLAESLEPRSGEPETRGAALVSGLGLEPPLLASSRRVAAHLGLKIPLTAADARRGRAEKVEQIAAASRFRVRQVLLRLGWWRKDGGPMLAFRGEERRPVALLPGARGGYRLHDPQAGEERRVDEALAEELQPAGYSFYRCFEACALRLRDVLRFALRGCSRDLATTLLMGSAAGLLGLVTPIATGLIFNDLIPSAERAQLVQLTLVLLAIAVATAIFQLGGSIAMVRVEGKMSSSLQSAVWDRLLSLPMTFFRPYTAGELATRAMGMDAIQQVLSGRTAHALVGGLFSIFHFGLLFYYSPPLAGWAVGFIAVAAATTLGVGRMQLLPERRVAEVRSRLSGTVLQLLSSVSKLQVAGAEVQAFALWAGRFADQRRHQYRSRTSANCLMVFNSVFPVVAQLALFALAFPMLTEEASLRIGDFLAFVASFTIAMQAVLTAGAALITTAVAVPLYEQALPILEASPEVDTAKAPPGELSGAIEVQSVRFRYERDGPYVLDGVTFTVEPGEFVALVGTSGSGKSTLLRLLLGFEEPSAGAVYYDRQDLSGLDHQEVRKQIGVVLQNARLMSGDIFGNIAGSSDATLDDAWEAARLAGFDEDVRKMPMKMHTVISEGGGTLSGGQRQRLMIARALIRRPRLLFFDEATSALDNRTQAIITRSLDQMQVTRVVVAHRLSTIESADTIHVLDRGRMVESGSYEELLRRDGPFRELAERQLV